MWVIERKSDGKKIYLLNKEYTVGRRDCTIQVPEDNTVSRKHLVLQPEYSNLKIKDLGSTYGTYLNPTSSDNGKIGTDKWTEMPNGSTFHFGIQNEWLLKWEDIRILCSAVGPTGRSRLNVALSKIGAKQVPDWESNITHLVMEKVVFTQKVMRGLINAKPIVTVEYFESWVNALDSNPSSPIPDLNKFIPPLDSSLTQVDKDLFLPNKARRNIFSGKILIFPTAEQFEAMSLPVEMAGGKALRSFDNFKDAILIEHSSKTPPDDYNTALKSLKDEGKRAVPMKEIGWAILTCSTQRYCNALLNLEHTLFGKVGHDKMNTAQLGAVLAPETQDLGVTLSRPREEQVFGQPPAKKIKVEQPEELSFKEPPAKKICLDSPNKTKSVLPGCIETRKSTSSIVNTLPTQSLPVSRATDTSTPNLDESTATQNGVIKDTTLSWHPRTDHSRTLNESSTRMMVKLNLVRSSPSQENMSLSREVKQLSLQENSHDISTRIRSMRIASYKDGRWIKSDDIINQV